MILVYIGVEDYLDPLNRFIAVSGDLVEFTVEEAEAKLVNEELLWEVYVEPDIPDEPEEV